MSRLAVVIVPAAPALLPGIGGSADPLADLREGARGAVADTAVSAKGARLVVVAAGDATREWDLDAPSGAERFTTGQVPKGALPTGLEIGRMFAPLRWGKPIGLRSIASDASPDECVALGREIVGDGPVALVVVADGPATLTEQAPGHLQPDAAAFASSLAQAVASPDTTALADLDPQTCDRLWMRGRPALQVLAGAAAGRDLRGELIADEAPQGRLCCCTEPAAGTTRR